MKRWNPPVLLPIIPLLTAPLPAAEFNIPAGDVGALRAALSTANASDENDVIRLAAGSTYILTDGGVAVGGGNILEGNGATLMRSDAEGTPAFTVLVTTDGSNLIATDDDVEVRDLTIANGRIEDPGFGEGGGGVHNVNEDGLVTLTRCVIRDCSSTDDGGGIFHGFFSETLRLVDCEIRDNSAEGNGGGLQADSDVILENTVFLRNTAGGNGGGFRCESSATIMGGRFEMNSTETGRGGGLFLESNVSIDGDCQFIGNSAFEGGGIFAESPLTWTGSGGLMRDNTATRVNQGGGALAITSTAEIEGVTFESNRSSRGGAVTVIFGSASFSSCTFDRNEGEFGGGAIYSDDDVTVEDCTFTSNRITGISGSGGAIEVRDNADPSTVVVRGGTFTGNEAKSGGAIRATGLVRISDAVFADNTAIGSGGALSVGKTVTVERCRFVGNRAEISTGATGTGGAIDIVGSSQVENVARVDRCYFRGNQAGFAGGAIRIRSVESSIVERCAFLDNEVNGDSSFIGGGGALASERTGLLLRSSSFIGNSSNTLGGGVRITLTSGEQNVLGCTFTDNEAAEGGGGLEVFGATVRLGNNVLFANTSDGAALDLNGADYTSLGFNVIGEAGSTTISGDTDDDRTGINPQLEPLADTGDFRSGRAPASGSPLIDSGQSLLGGSLLPYDQRGFGRPSDLLAIANGSGSDGSDVGAFELIAPDTEQGGPIALVNTTDSGFDGICGVNHCSLSDAINAALSPDGPTEIRFDETVFPAGGPMQTITLQSPLEDLVGELAIIGPGASALTIARDDSDATPGFPIFVIRPGASVTLSGVTISKGVGLDPDASNQSKGGGIYCEGDLVLSHCVIRECVAQFGGGLHLEAATNATVNDCEFISNRAEVAEGARGNPSGGGLNQERDFEGTGSLSVLRCRFIGNASLPPTERSGAFGGGIRSEAAISVDQCLFEGNTATFGAGAEFRSETTVSRCTFTGNIASTAAGGLAIGNGTVVNSTITNNMGGTVGPGGVRADDDTVILHCTISGNSTAGSGGGIGTSRDIFQMGHTVVAGNTADGDGPDINSTFQSLGYNLISDTGSTLIFGVNTGNQIGIDPKLEALADNGGFVPTMASATGSPLRDAGNPSLAEPPTTDARGFARIANSAIDIGAYEHGAGPAGTSYASFATQEGLGAATADDDLDGACNLLEFALGTDATNPGEIPALPNPGATDILIEKADGIIGVDFLVESSTDLAGWDSIDLTVTEDSAERLSVSYPAIPRRFLRLTVSLAP